MSLSLSDNKLFFGPKHNIYAFFMILFGWFDSILLFVMWIVNQKINKFIFFKLKKECIVVCLNVYYHLHEINKLQTKKTIFSYKCHLA